MTSSWSRSSIDLNADVAEGFDDAGMLASVTSANVACGFHAGDPATMLAVCRLAAERGVRIGAQVSYRDREGFGRRFLPVAADELIADLLYQLGALAAIARTTGVEIAYVKPHGALYNAVVTHEQHSAAVVAAVAEFEPTLPLLGLPGARVLEVARAAGVPTVTEAFADRAYTPAGTLVPRSEPDAVLHDPERVVAQALRIATTGQVVAVDGTAVPVSAGSLCVHGDTPGAVVLAHRVRQALEAAGVTVEPFA